MKTYENHDLGIAFEYPSEWTLVYNCRVRYGVDVLMTCGLMSFGIMKVSDRIIKKNSVMLSSRTLKEILKSTVQLNEAIFEDVQINKYVVRDSFTATITVSKKHHKSTTTTKTTTTLDDCIMIAQKTLLEYAFDNNQLLLVVLEDTPENYELGNSQSQLRLLFDSFRFLC